MPAAGLLLLALLSAAETGPESVFDEERFGIELGGYAAVTRPGWVYATSGPGFGVTVRFRFGARLSAGLALEAVSAKSPEMERPWTMERKQIAFDVQWRFDTGPHIRPWASLGMGFGKVDLAYDDGAFIGSAHAVDLVRLGLGVDFVIGRHLILGPFVRGSLGRTGLASPADLETTPPPDTHRGLNTLELGARALIGF
ncbi:MAG TPA: outer membrane beta-barrel protein [Myxococcaceae bacterium]|nr:outer membrane beta-barrel protein [Myxococcaceae bacterium]